MTFAFAFNQETARALRRSGPTVDDRVRALEHSGVGERVILTGLWLVLLMLAASTTAAADFGATDVASVSQGSKTGGTGTTATLPSAPKGDLGAGTPDVSECGSRATVTGGNTAGTITGIDTDITSCTMRFSSPQAVVPVCVTSMISNVGGGVLVGATTKSSVTFIFPASAGLVIRYICTAPR